MSPVLQTFIKRVVRNSPNTRAHVEEIDGSKNLLITLRRENLLVRVSWRPDCRVNIYSNQTHAIDSETKEEKVMKMSPAIDEITKRLGPSKVTPIKKQ